MKKLILILLLAVSLCGCFKDDYTGCPADMTLSFYLDDAHVPGTYDTRIGNDVLVYVFSDQMLVSTMNIPYAEIQSGRQYTFRKTEAMKGTLELVAWAVPVTLTREYVPSFAPGDRVGDRYFSMEAFTRSMNCRNPKLNDIYMGTLTFGEAIDRSSSHQVAMIHAGCRITVNVNDLRSLLDDASEIHVNGTMTRMGMDKKGCGDTAVVYVDLPCPSRDARNYTTGMFSVLPSPEGQTLSIHISNRDGAVATLTVPDDNVVRGATAGDLMVFDYVLGESSFELTVNGFRQILYSVTM